MPESTRPTDLTAFLQQEALPDSYRQQAERYFLPLLDALQARVRRGQLRVLGIHGAQGSGKSTLAALLQWYLSKHWGLNVAQLSLDDFYLTRAQRRALARQYHPLFATRGVPGTHDIPLALHTLTDLKQLAPGQTQSLVHFDKSRDDRAVRADWPRATGPLDLIVLEGWCVGAPPQSELALQQPVNALEEKEDGEGLWRHRVNAELAGPYQTLFSQLDYLLMLQAPSFDCVAGWRLEQEQKLARRKGGDAPGLMGPAEIDRFVQFYQRLTEHCLACLPARADAVLEMAADRQIVAARF